MPRKYNLKRKKTPKSTWLEGLNEQQEAVVQAGGGALLVLAGAGSGKTRTLTRRVARLLSIGVSPGRILLLTFTNKAAREMIRRVEEFASGKASQMWGGTFHHVGHKILRRHAEVIGYPPNFGIMDSADCQDLFDVCLSDFSETSNLRLSKLPKGKVLHRIYSLAVNTKRPIAQVIHSEYPYFGDRLGAIEEILLHYSRRKHQMGLMDFDDLLLCWLQLFTQFPEIRDEYAERFEHVLVDEYQDTNQLQGELIDLCAGKHQNITVVGDDCQSIYSFRGANFENILRFPQRYPGCHVFLLEMNYRSTPEILSLANTSILFNEQRFEKELKATLGSGVMPALIPCDDAYQQAEFIVQRIVELLEEGTPAKEIALLYRAHYQSMQLQLELTRQEIPFTVRSGMRFFEQAHVKDLLAFLRFLSNPLDELSFIRFVKIYEGIGKQMTKRIWKHIQQANDPLERLLNSGEISKVTAKAHRSLGEIARLFKQLQEGISLRPGALIQAVLDEVYAKHVQKSFTNAQERLDELQQLADFAERFLSLEGFLAELSLHSSIADAEAEKDTVNASEDCIVLSSIHQAKGLEWDAVFITSLYDGGFPSGYVLKGGKSEEEEERRLFYVAVTRAKRELYMTYPVRGDSRRGYQLQVPSLFVRELLGAQERSGRELMEAWELEPSE